MLPFIKTPSDAGFSNNKSALTKGRKWLILDLLYVNDHLYKEKKKFDDWKCFENYLQANKVTFSSLI